ncbi:MAG TPA: hypothetical protein VH640_31510 [Bryobacteraceae bacterium]
MNYLQNAVESMESVSIGGNGPERIEARQQALTMWFTILAAIDKELDPNFNPDDAPPESVRPRSSGAAVYPSGIDPNSIPDPEVRAEYEAALEENERKVERYRLQIRLRRIDPRATSDVERSLIRHYTTSAVDQDELDGLIKSAKLSGARQKQLKVLFQNRDRI